MMVRQGLSFKGLLWSLSTFHAANWHPLTWLSHMLDVQLFGMNPLGHHATSLLIHTANALLLCALLHRLTGFVGRSLVVALLFAIHPLHVESVAWVAERKDLLCAFFFLLALFSYLRYTRRLRWYDFLVVLLCSALSLMAKPMSVTLPFVLLLLDRWPLQRTGASISTRTLILEKTPLMLLSGISCIVTIFAQKAGGAVIAVEKHSMFERITNALSSYAHYLWQSLWPLDLAILYPLAYKPPILTGAVGAVIIVLTVTVSIRQRNSRPYLLVGTLWYLGMLVPVIGLVQVGVQSHADRYTYLPLIGCYIAVVWGLHDLAEEMNTRKTARILAAVIVLVVFAFLTRQQVHVWRNSETLFRHALAKTSENYVMHTNLGIALWDSNRQEEAIAEIRKGIAICPMYDDPHFILANALLVHGDPREAAEEYRTTLRLRPDYPHAHTNLAMALEKTGQVKEAILAYQEGLRRDPTDYKARENLQILTRK
jgi:tetratricopeptide (TPR) repeat protein